MRSCAPKWAQDLLRHAGCTVIIKGEEHLTQAQALANETGLLYVANHQGNFDIPILMAILPAPVGFVAKDPLKKLPLVSRWMTHIGCVFIHQNDPRKAASAIQEGIRNLKKGHAMAVFPEGTRSKDGSLGEFKAGALKLATKSGSTILPIAIDGSIHTMKKDSYLIQPATVTVTFFPPIDAEMVKTMDTVKLTEHIQNQIERAFC